MHNEKRLLITLCISCHVRLHRYRGFSRWIPKALLELWNEIHSGQPFQLQLPFAVPTRAVSRSKWELEKGWRLASRDFRRIALKFGGGNRRGEELSGC
jgi:hypothetical protein